MWHRVGVSRQGCFYLAALSLDGLINTPIKTYSCCETPPQCQHSAQVKSEERQWPLCVQMAPGCPVPGPGTLVHLSLPALPTVPVTLRDGRLYGALPGAVADFTASQGVEVEGIHLTDLTLGPDCVGWAEALPCPLFTKAPATITSCQGVKGHRVRAGLHSTGVSRSFQGVWGKWFPLPSLRALLMTVHDALDQDQVLPGEAPK